MTRMSDGHSRRDYTANVAPPSLLRQPRVGFDAAGRHPRHGSIGAEAATRRYASARNIQTRRRCVVIDLLASRKPPPSEYRHLRAMDRAVEALHHCEQFECSCIATIGLRAEPAKASLDKNCAPGEPILRVEKPSQGVP
jgi:hypothetical protein